MMRNVGSIDRVVRVVASVAILAAGFAFKSWWGLVGVVPLLTATLGWCPLYAPFGLSTCPMKSRTQH